MNNSNIVTYGGMSVLGDIFCTGNIIFKKLVRDKSEESSIGSNLQQIYYKQKDDDFFKVAGHLIVKGNIILNEEIYDMTNIQDFVTIMELDDYKQSRNSFTEFSCDNLIIYNKFASTNNIIYSNDYRIMVIFRKLKISNIFKKIKK